MSSSDEGYPFLSIVTRVCWRPRMLQKNIDSVLAQTDKDIEQVFILDRKKRGLNAANTHLWKFKHRVSGRYVYMLDDDTRLVNDGFVASLRRAVGESGNPGVVLVKHRRALDGRPVPPGDVWDLDWENGARPKRWIGNGQTVVVRNDLWMRHISAYNVGEGGSAMRGRDWHFVTGLISSGTTFIRLNMVVAEGMQRGYGTEFENCKKGWFGSIRNKYGIDGTLILDLWRRQ